MMSCEPVHLFSLNTTRGSNGKFSGTHVSKLQSPKKELNPPLKKNHPSPKQTSFGIIKKPPRYTELKMIVDDRVGLLKDISSVISEKRVNIHSTHSEPQSPKHHRIKIRCETDSKETMEKLILKLKKIKEIKEISYKLI